MAQIKQRVILDSKEVQIVFPFFLFQSVEAVAKSFASVVSVQTREPSKVISSDNVKYFVSRQEAGEEYDKAYSVSISEDSVFGKRYSILDQRPDPSLHTPEWVIRKSIMAGFRDYLDDILKDYEATHPEYNA